MKIVQVVLIAGQGHRGSGAEAILNNNDNSGNSIAIPQTQPGRRGNSRGKSSTKLRLIIIPINNTR